MGVNMLERILSLLLLKGFMPIVRRCLRHLQLIHLRQQLRSFLRRKKDLLLNGAREQHRLMDIIFNTQQVRSLLRRRQKQRRFKVVQRRRLLIRN